MADLTAGVIPKATAATVIGDSLISESGDVVTIAAPTSGEIDVSPSGGAVGAFLYVDATSANLGVWGGIPLTFSVDGAPGGTVLGFEVTGAAVFAGPVTQKPAASQTPANNGDLVVQATSNTQITFKLKGSDGVVRSGNLTLA